MTEPELLPCPFCGSQNVRRIEAMGETWATCQECKGTCDLPMWNRRASAPRGRHPKNVDGFWNGYVGCWDCNTDQGSKVEDPAPAWFRAEMVKLDAQG
jgi:hypothetical protein